MNRLALSSDGILVSERAFEEGGLQIGDELYMRVGMNNQLAIGSWFTVVGTYDYFPTVYEEDELAVIGNMEYLSTIVGVPLPHNIWLRTEDGADGKAILDAVPRTTLWPPSG
jgi:hypothetical protein